MSDEFYKVEEEKIPFTDYVYLWITILLPPLGAFLLWKNEKGSLRTRMIVSIISAIYLILIIGAIFGLTGRNQGSTGNITPNTQKNISSTAQETPEVSEIPEGEEQEPYFKDNSKRPEEARDIG